jgi:hypothetical protein
VLNPVARTVGARTSLLAGFETLERSLAFATGDADGAQLLQQAQVQLEQAVAEDATNPLGFALLGSCLLNQARAAAQAGDDAQAQSLAKASGAALRKANRFRTEAEFAYIKREIEADYALLVTKDYEQAIAAYEELSGTSPDTPLHTALRANWMLAGIYSGDWGIAEAAPEVLDSEKAKQHLVNILAHWTDSSEADFIRKNLRWDGELGENRFQHFPRVNEDTAEAFVDA